MKTKALIISICLLILLIGCFSKELSIHEDMVRVDGGEFFMGIEDYTSNFIKIRLDDYYISRYETTVEQWEQFLKETETPYSWKGEYIDMREKSPYPDSPIGVRWQLAVLFANWVSRKYELEECYVIDGDDVEWVREANGYRLPTDAEWEFAARGGNLSKNYKYAGGDDLDEVAWTGWNSDNHTHPVGLKKANELGLYDMSGNAFEWCWDLHEEYPHDKSVLLINPTGPSLIDYESINDKRWRIARGGGSGTVEYFSFTPHFRSGAFEFGSDRGLGFRLARNAE